MSTADIYEPRAESLPGRCIAYFRRLPDEELSIKDIAMKFQTDVNSVHTQLKQAVEHRLLSRDGLIYSAGDNISRPQAGEVAASKLGATPIKPGKPKGHSAPRHTLDLTTLQVEEGVPYIPPTAGKGKAKWDPLFEKLSGPNQSIAVPGHLRGALSAAAAKRNKEKRGTFKVAMTGPDQARVWRVA